MKKVRVEFDNSEYVFENGCCPKGFGYWVFAFEGREFSCKGTLTEAKKACRAEIERVAPIDYVGTVKVTVLP